MKIGEVCRNATEGSEPNDHNKKYKLIICIFWLLCSVGLSGCRDHRSEMLLTGQAETENTKTPEETEAVDAEITKAAKEEEQAEPVETPTETAETLAKIFVDVCGAVVNPGVYEMEGDSRIFRRSKQREVFAGSGDETCQSGAAGQ